MRRRLEGPISYIRLNLLLPVVIHRIVSSSLSGGIVTRRHASDCLSAHAVHCIYAGAQVDEPHPAGLTSSHRPHGISLARSLTVRHLIP